MIILDVDSPLGALIGSTTWHKNISFPSRPSLSCRQLTPVRRHQSWNFFLLAPTPVLSSEPPSFHKLKVE